MPNQNFRLSFLAIAAIALSTGCSPKPTPTPSSASSTTDTSVPISKSAESVGKTNIRAAMRGQQAFFLEKNKFGGSIDELVLGIKPDTESYKYEVADLKPKQVKITATAKNPTLKSFTASVFVVGEAGNELTTGVICGTDQPSQTPPEVSPTPKAATEVLTCPAGSSIAE